MTTKKITTNGAIYLLILLLVVVVFMLSGGVTWIKGMMNTGSSLHMGSLNWLQIFIGLIVGFLLGILAGRRKW
jgi:hypothetical protein